MHENASYPAMAQYHMYTNGKLTQDGVTSLSYRNLNKIIRAGLCSGFACYLHRLLSWKNWIQFLRQKTAHFN